MKKHIVYTLTFVLACSVVAPVSAYGSSSSSSTTTTSTASAPVCGAEKPQAPLLMPVVSTTRMGAYAQANLAWYASNKATKYLVQYGLSPRNYIYGAPDVGNTTNYTINYLTPGVTYYFSVRAVNDCMPSDLSNESSIRAGGGRVAYMSTGIGGFAGPVYATDQTTPTPTPTPKGEEQMGDAVIVTAPQEGEPQPVVVVEQQKDNFFTWLWKSIQRIFGVK